MKHLLIAALLLYSFGCSSSTKKLVVGEDAIAGAASVVHTAYTNHLLTKDDVKAVQPYFDSARDAALKVENQRATNVPEIFWDLSAVESAISAIESRPEVQKAHATTTTPQTTVTP